MRTIAMIGGGPGGVSLCLQFTQQFQALARRSPVELLVFEKTGQIGHGLPYAAANDGHLLNLPKQVMEPIPGERDQFAQWYAAHVAVATATDFPPRHYFGQYLAHRAYQTQQDAQALGLTITYLTHHEVVDIEQDATGMLTLVTSQGTYRAHEVILSMGHLPSRLYTEFLGQPGYCHQPTTIVSDPPPGTIGILGTRLTAIETALTLRARNHQGAIKMVSRSGLLPTVLGKAVPAYTLRYMTPDALDVLTHGGQRALPLRELATLFWQEMDAVLDNTCHLHTLPRTLHDVSALDWLTQEIREAEQGARPWQQVLFALYPLTPLIWSLLNAHDQQYFLTHYYSLFMTYLAAFPLENAYKMHHLLATNQLTLHSHLTHVTYDGQCYGLHCSDQPQPMRCDYLINATGPGYDSAMNPLLVKMMARSLITGHRLGGIEIDKATFQVKDNQGQPNRHLFAIGEVTKGDCFLTADLGIVTTQARVVIAQLIAQLAAG